MSKYTSAREKEMASINDILHNREILIKSITEKTARNVKMTQHYSYIHTQQHRDGIILTLILHTNA